jgi:hypothetical protein
MRLISFPSTHRNPVLSVGDRQTKQDASNIALMRQRLCSKSTDISFATKRWQVFRAVITGALDELISVSGGAATLLMVTIEVHIQCWFVHVLQLDSRTLRH